jgi:hypothetical protein
MANTGTGNCVTADNLASMINVGQFNKMMKNTENVATGFLTSYVQSQNQVSTPTVDLNLARYEQTALKIKREMIEKHDKMIVELNKIHGQFVTQIQSAKHTKDLYEILGKQNDKLRKAVEGEIHTIEISDRKTYYENEQNGYAGGWSSFLNSLYKYVIIALIIIIIMKKRYRETKLWGIIIALIMYPTIVYYLIEFVKYGYYSIASKTNWVYLQL